jgi:hypothetical protein
MITTEERNRLVKVRVDYQGNGQWQLRPEFTKGGSRVSKGKRIFRGDDEEFRKFLIRCKAAETETTPASKRTKRYADIVQDMKANKATYVWMYTNRWKAENGITTVNAKENTMKKETLQYLSENVDEACEQVRKQLDSYGFGVSGEVVGPYDLRIGGDTDFTSSAKHVQIEPVPGQPPFVVQIAHSALDNTYDYYVYDQKAVRGGTPDAGEALFESDDEDGYSDIGEMITDLIDDLEDYFAELDADDLDAEIEATAAAAEAAEEEEEFNEENTKRVSEMIVDGVDYGDDPIEPDEDDAYIHDAHRGYSVSVEGRHLGMYQDLGDAEDAIIDWMSINQFWPSVWFVDERGWIEPHNLYESAESKEDEKTITIQEDFQLPGTDIILEAGDHIKLVEDLAEAAIKNTKRALEKRGFNLNDFTFNKIKYNEITIDHSDFEGTVRLKQSLPGTFNWIIYFPGYPMKNEYTTSDSPTTVASMIEYYFYFRNV